mgnify:CR=1 FL=1
MDVVRVHPGTSSLNTPFIRWYLEVLTECNGVKYITNMDDKKVILIERGMLLFF